MKLQVLNRKVHYWGSIVLAIPLLIIILSGIVLQLKKHAEWIQPTEFKGVGKEPAIAWEKILEICRRVERAEVKAWSDINRIDVRPSRGMLKVWAKSNWEIQIDLQTGEVLHVAYRRSDMIEAIHDGSWLHDTVKWGLFFPAGIVLLVLWITGIYMFFLPIIRRRKSARFVRAKDSLSGNKLT